MKYKLISLSVMILIVMYILSPVKKQEEFINDQAIELSNVNTLVSQSNEIRVVEGGSRSLEEIIIAKQPGIGYDRAIYYSSLIKEATEEYSYIDDLWILAMMWVESRFNEDVVSSAGAIGLMQILPSTAAYYGVSKHELFDPKININFGVFYLNYLVTYYESLKIGTIAYERGMGNVNKGNYNKEYYTKVKEVYEELKMLESLN